MLKQQSLLFIITVLICYPALADKQLDANSPSQTTTKINDIKVIINPIFNEKDPNSFFLHRLANSLHIDTKISTVLDLLPVKNMDQLNDAELEEIQRVLKAQHFLRDVKTRIMPSVDSSIDSSTLVIETWDNWSLLPTFSLGRSGGEKKFSFGIKEDNLMGMGVKTRIKYKSDRDRTGYKLGFDTPVSWMDHARLSAEIGNNSDGHAIKLFFNKPFYLLSEKQMFSVFYNQDKQTDTLRQNGEEIDSFEQDVIYSHIQYGQLIKRQNNSYYRMLIGITKDSNQFDQHNYNNLPHPNDREYLYPWLGFNYIEDDFQIVNNIHLINFNEDLNIGWQHYFQLGVEINDNKDDSLGYHINAISNKGFQFNNHLLLVNLNFFATLNTKQSDFYRLTLGAENFYQITPKWTSYTYLRLISSHNNPINQPITLGDQTGIRGYPNDYQHGDQQWLFTAELRNYPNINLYQLAELGWAVFTDVGQSFGDGNDDNAIKSPIGSIGIGLRIYSSRSSFGNVAHIDLSLPYQQGMNVNDWEWRIQIKSHF